MVRRLKSVAGDSSGVVALEYAVLAGIVVSALIVAAVVLSGNTGLYSTVFQSMWNTISSVTSGS